MTNVRPRVLAILPGFIPSTFINIINPLLTLHRTRHIVARIDLEFLPNRKNVKWADLVVFCRNTEPDYCFTLNFFLKHQIPFIYDIDDNFFEIPIDSEVGKYHHAPERLATLTRYLESANLVRVYSLPLFERVKTFNQKVEMVSAPIDFGSILPSQKLPGGNKIGIVYATSRIEDELSQMFMPALKRILKRYDGIVELHFWGPKVSGLESFKGVNYHKPILQYNHFLRQFSEGGYDIGLAPLKGDIFHRSKTNNKFREYGGCRIAGIYSNVDVYSNCVTNMETGLLVPNDPESWYEGMVRLIEDHHLREKIKAQALQYVLKYHSQEHFEKIWWNQIKRALEEASIISDTKQATDDAAKDSQRSDGGSHRTRHSTDLRREKARGAAANTHILKQLSGLMRLNGIQNSITHLRNHGISRILGTSRVFLFSFWMVLRLRFLTSRVFEILNRRKP